MKKRIMALVLSLGLSFGLVAPASASENLDVSIAEEYMSILTEDYQRSNIIHANLLDMDSDGILDLLIVSMQDYSSESANVDIWQVKNNDVVHTTHAECVAREYGSIGLFKQGTQTYVYAKAENSSAGARFNTHYIIGANGISNQYSHDYLWADNLSSEEHTFSQTISGQKKTITESAYYQALAAYGCTHTEMDVTEPSGYTEFGTCELPEQTLYLIYTWVSSSSEYSYSDTLLKLQLQIAHGTPEDNTPVTGSYEPFTISGLNTFDYTNNCEVIYSVTFDQALVAQREIATLNSDVGGSGLETKSVSLIYLKPGSQITIEVNGKQVDSLMTLSLYGTIEDGVYSEEFSGAVEGDMLYSGTVEKSFKPGTFLHLGWDNYVLLADDNVVATVGGFSDVKESAYYADAVQWAVENGVTTGTSATTFSPDATCTTGQIITFLWRANGSPSVSGVTPFDDVSSSDYYYQAALWAKEEGLVSGSSFQGNTPCTRAATVTYLWKLADQPSVGTSKFTDVPNNADYAQAVAWAVQEGITSGTGNNAFSPNAICTRGQIVTFIYRDMAG